MRELESYREIVGDAVLAEIYQSVRRLYGKKLLEVNSTYVGGGVAEMLNSFVYLMNDIGIETDWAILHGNPEFFAVTRKIHDGLQGRNVELTEENKRIYHSTNEDFSVFTHIDHDAVIIHDPQPLPMIKFYKKRQPWIWRCHIDLSHPNQDVWGHLKRYIIRYDELILSHEAFRRSEVPIRQRVIQPCIDPLSPKNMDMRDDAADDVLQKFGVPLDKPLVTQISRFDLWKDPEGVVDVYEMVRSKVDCRLVLCGSFATDDPDGVMMYEYVKRRAEHLIARGDVILLTANNDLLVNALQRRSAVIVQKSLKEGFGLTVTEALWKETPVVASKVGGIPLQITDGVNGYLIEPTDNEGYAERIVHILRNPDVAHKISRNGKRVVLEKFLITRLLRDYLVLLNDLLAA